MPYNLALPVRGIYSRKTKTYPRKDLAALFVRDVNWKYLKRPTDEWIASCGISTHIIEYYWAKRKKRKEILCTQFFLCKILDMGGGVRAEASQWLPGGGIERNEEGNAKEL